MKKRKYGRIRKKKKRNSNNNYYYYIYTGFDDGAVDFFSIF